VRVALVVGHREHAQGATAVDGGQEWAFNRVLADQTAAAMTALGHDVRVFLRPDIAGYTTAMRRLIERVNGYEPDLVISMHYNAAPNPQKGQWHGTEALYWPSSRAGKMWATQLSGAVARAQGTYNRGPKARSESWAGSPLLILRDTDAPAVIVETHFGDYASDHARALAARDSGATAQAIASVLP